MWPCTSPSSHVGATPGTPNTYLGESRIVWITGIGSSEGPDVTLYNLREGEDFRSSLNQLHSWTVESETQKRRGLSRVTRPPGSRAGIRIGSRSRLETTECQPTTGSSCHAAVLSRWETDTESTQVKLVSEHSGESLWPSGQHGIFDLWAPTLRGLYTILLSFHWRNTTIFTWQKSYADYLSTTNYLYGINSLWVIVILRKLLQGEKQKHLSEFRNLH